MEQHLRAAQIFATLLDNRFSIGKFRFGISALIDLIPGIGDVFDAILSFYLLWIAREMGVPSGVMVKMVMNILISFIVGLVPIVGDAGYLLYKPNLRNLRLLQSFVDAQGAVVEGQIVE